MLGIVVRPNVDIEAREIERALQRNGGGRDKSHSLAETMMRIAPQNM